MDELSTPIYDPVVDMAKKKPQKSHIIPLSILLVITIIGSGYYYSLNNYTKRKSSNISPSPSLMPKPTRSPYPLVPDKGTAGTYTISQSNKIGPIFSNFSIDPLSPSYSKQTRITLTIKSQNEITKLTAQIIGDQSTQNIDLQRTNRLGDIETWTSNFLLTEIVNYTYIYRFTANDGTTEIHFDLPLRTD